MDVEGIDIAVLFPSRALSVLTRADLDPRFAAAVARAYNDWLFDFCQGDPTRLYGAGMLSDAAKAATHRRQLRTPTPTPAPAGSTSDGAKP